jgi:quaternary ammonium compound-resistance protein SugE
MSWILLVAAGVFEVIWASLLERTDGFSRLVPTLGFVATLVVSMVLLSLAVRTIPIGTAYAVWVGIGAVGAFGVSVVGERRPTSGPQLLAMAALVGSILAVKATSSS